MRTYGDSVMFHDAILIQALSDENGDEEWFREWSHGNYSVPRFQDLGTFDLDTKKSNEIEVNLSNDLIETYEYYTRLSETKNTGFPSNSHGSRVT